jgi:RimJ/RimL family protein N-acetyltransferase
MGGEPIRLVPLRQRHLRRMMVWERDPRTRDFIMLDRPSTFADMLDRLSPQDGVRHLAMEIRPCNLAVGYLRLVRAVERGQTLGSFEILISPAFRRRGYARAILERIEDVLDEQWSTRLVKIGVFDDNVAARRLYEDLGYHEVATEWWEVGGRRRRAIMMTNRPDLLRGRRIGF